MPELPEVETTRRFLAPALEGRRIDDADVRRPRMVRRQARPADFPDRLRGRISSLFTMCVLTSFPLGGLLGGLAAERVGAPATTTVTALLALLLIVTIHTTHPKFRHAA